MRILCSSCSTQINHICRVLGGLAKLTMGARILQLNVGGRIFATAHQTLAQHDGSLLANLVTGGQSASVSYLDGALFIDRNPKYFEVLLDWLRDKDAPLPANIESLEALSREAAFYRIPELAAAVARSKSQTHSTSADAILEVNVGGKRFMVSRWLLSKHPGSLLARISAKDAKAADWIAEVEGCLFIDRDPQLFDYILFWLRSGQLKLSYFQEFGFTTMIKEAEAFGLQELVLILHQSRPPGAR